jgi:hypothetical protein
VEKQGAVMAPVGGSKHKNGVAERATREWASARKRKSTHVRIESRGKDTPSGSLSYFARFFPDADLVSAQQPSHLGPAEPIKRADNKLHQFACCWPHSCPSVGIKNGGGTAQGAGPLNGSRGGGGGSGTVRGWVVHETSHVVSAALGNSCSS